MTEPSVACANCLEPMQARDLERHDFGVVRVDLCFPCAGIWFDHLESAQLAPSGVIELFKEIAAHQGSPRRPIAARLDCPCCHQALLTTHDLGKAGRFSYYRCPKGEGRYTPFFQFLREKQFVRTLTPVELQRVRAQVREIKCSGCGAPIDLEHDAQCRYCRAPVSFLDPEAVQKALELWSNAGQRERLAPTKHALGDTMQQLRLNPARIGDRLLLQGTPATNGQVPGLSLDLVQCGIHAIGRLLSGSA